MGFGLLLHFWFSAWSCCEGMGKWLGGDWPACQGQSITLSWVPECLKYEHIAPPSHLDASSTICQVFPIFLFQKCHIDNYSQKVELGASKMLCGVCWTVSLGSFPVTLNLSVVLKTQWNGMLTRNTLLILADENITKESETLLSKKIVSLFPNQWLAGFVIMDHLLQFFSYRNSAVCHEELGSTFCLGFHTPKVLDLNYLFVTAWCKLSNVYSLNASLIWLFILVCNIDCFSGCE